MVYILKKVYTDGKVTNVYFSHIKDARKDFNKEIMNNDPYIKDMFLYRKFTLSKKEELIKYGHKTIGDI